MLKPKRTAARVVSVRFMTILSKRSWEESVQKLCFLLLKFAVPVIKFVVAELVPLRGGNEFGTRLQNKILVSFRSVVEIFRRAPPSLL